MAAALSGGGYSVLAFVRDDLRPRFDPAGPTGQLSNVEMGGIQALAEVLIPSRLRVREGRVRREVDAATSQEPGVFTEYRNGLRLLDRYAETRSDRPFRELAPDAREEVLDDLLWRYDAEDDAGLDPETLTPLMLRRMERVWHRGAVRRFRQLVIRDLLKRLYQAGVPLLIGYTNLPGVPGDPRDYVNPPRRRPDI